MSDSPLPSDKDVAETDLNRLIAAQAREGYALELKREYLPDGNRKKFLQTVAAFANFKGGDLVMGISEQKGAAHALSPLPIDPDKARLQMIDLIRIHIRPRLAGVKIETVPIASGGFVIVVRVPRSWAGPHLQAFEDERFFIRDDGKNRTMLHEEVRDGFLGGEQIAAKLRNFRTERFAALLSDEGFARLVSPSQIALHVLPFGMFANPRRVDLQILRDKCRQMHISPLTHMGNLCSIDVDGCYCASGRRNETAHSYVYVYRSGAIEAVDTVQLTLPPQPQMQRAKLIQSRSLESAFMAVVPPYFKLLQSIEVEPPFAVFLTLLNVEGFTLVDTMRPFGHPIVQRHVQFPEIVQQDFPQTKEEIVKPLIDSIWNAAGEPECPNFDDRGRWLNP